MGTLSCVRVFRSKHAFLNSYEGTIVCKTQKFTPLLLTFVFLSLAGQCPADELDLVRAGYAQRMSMIHSVQAVYKLQAVKLAEGSARDLDIFEWTAEGSRWRYRKGQNDMEKVASLTDRGPSIKDLPIDAIANGDELTTVAQMLSGQPQATISTVTKDVFLHSDFRSRMLDYAHDSPPLVVANVLDGKHGHPTCRRGESGDYIISCEVDLDHLIEVEFVPDKNFVVRRIENFYRTNDRFTGYRIEANEFVEAKPGIWFPNSTDKVVIRRSETGDPEAPTGANRCLIVDLKVNEEIPRGKFEVRLPPGTEVDNQITGKRYTVRADGTKTEEEPLPELQVNKTFETTGGNHSISTWIIVLNLVLAAVIGIFLLFRRQV